MEIEIIEKNENVLLARTEVRFRIDHRGGPTPGLADVRSKLVNALGAKPELLIVHRYASSFGADAAEGTARVYSDAKVLARVERRVALVKNGLIKEEKKKAEGEEAAAEAKAPAEAKAEVKAEAKAEGGEKHAKKGKAEGGEA